MTFQEARLKLLEPEKFSKDTLKKALETIKYYQQNTLDLEDYETDQLEDLLRILGRRPDE